MGSWKAHPPTVTASLVSSHHRVAQVYRMHGPIPSRALWDGRPARTTPHSGARRSTSLGLEHARRGRPLASRVVSRIDTVPSPVPLGEPAGGAIIPRKGHYKQPAKSVGSAVHTGGNCSSRRPIRRARVECDRPSTPQDNASTPTPSPSIASRFARRDSQGHSAESSTAATQPARGFLLLPQGTRRRPAWRSLQTARACAATSLKTAPPRGTRRLQCRLVPRDMPRHAGTPSGRLLQSQWAAEGPR